MPRITGSKREPDCTLTPSISDMSVEPTPVYGLAGQQLTSLSLPGFLKPDLLDIHHHRRLGSCSSRQAIRQLSAS